MKKEVQKNRENLLSEPKKNGVICLKRQPRQDPVSERREKSGASHVQTPEAAEKLPSLMPS